MNKLISLESCFKQSVERLKQAGIDNPALEARLIMELSTGLSASEQITGSEKPLSQKEIELSQQYISQRIKGEPFAYLKGNKEFWSLNFKVNQNTLIPRPDSETLIEAALEHAPKNKRINILELGVGTGCLILSLLNELPYAKGLGVDNNKQALEIARHNSKFNQLAYRVEFKLSDWFAEIKAESGFDFIITNPPYISSSEYKNLPREVRSFEPREALIAGYDGLKAYRQIAEQIGKHLTPGGFFITEIGNQQMAEVTEIFSNAGLKLHSHKNDLAGITRVLVFCR